MGVLVASVLIDDQLSLVGIFLDLIGVLLGVLLDLIGVLTVLAVLQGLSNVLTDLHGNLAAIIASTDVLFNLSGDLIKGSSPS